jgi:hypothetical protein
VRKCVNARYDSICGGLIATVPSPGPSLSLACCHHVRTPQHDVPVSPDNRSRLVTQVQFVYSTENSLATCWIRGSALSSLDSNVNGFAAGRREGKSALTFDMRKSANCCLHVVVGNVFITGCVDCRHRSMRVPCPLQRLALRLIQSGCRCLP